MSGTFTSVAIGVLVLSAVGLGADSGSPGPLAQTCGVPPAAASTAGGEPSGARKVAISTPGTVVPVGSRALAKWRAGPKGMPRDPGTKV